MHHPEFAVTGADWRVWRSMRAMSSSGDTELYRFLREVAGAQPDPAYLRVPKTAGRYRVEERLGQGGLGLVHAGWDPQLGRSVAIKFVRLDRTGGEPGRRLQERLKSEAQALAKLAHPHVVPVFDVGDAEGQVFVAMQRIEGMTLRQWLATRPSLARRLAVLEAAGSGLAAAHEVGVVHRDVKPDNVLVGAEDHAWVVDFGLAHEVDTPTMETLEDGSVKSETGGVLGTEGYLAPELLDGDSPTPLSDQFAFSRTLGEAIGAGSPDWLLAIVERGLDDDPRRRFASMRALLAALRKGGERRSWRIASGLVGTAILGIGVAAAIPSTKPTTATEEVTEVRSSAAAAANLARGREAVADEDLDADVYLQAAFFEGREAGDDAVAGEAATLLGSVELHRARLDGAKYWAEHARALRGDDPEVVVLSAEIKLFDGQPEVALQQLQGSLGPNASDDALIVAGQAAAQLERASEARQYLARAQGEEALYQLIDLELELGELDDAQAHLRQAFARETDPSGPTAAARRMQMGNLLREQGKFDEALGYLDEALAMLAGLDHPDEAVIEDARGLVHEMKGDTATARACYERALVIPRGDDRSRARVHRLHLAAADLGGR